jgi:foldase protein PrsA
MPNLRRSTLAVLAVAASAAGLTACGESIPGNAVVKVEDTSIKKDDYNHWLEVAAISSASQADPAAAQSGKKPVVNLPEPPDYARCVADKKKSAPKPAKGRPATKDSEYVEQCKTEYEALRSTVLSFLISAEWIEGEAAEQDIKVAEADVKKKFAETRKQSFPKEADFRKFLASSGQSEEDLLYRVRLDELSNKLRDKIVKGKDKVSDAQIAAYYNKNKQRFAQPERRDVRIVLTKTEDKAREARRALTGGDSFKSVAKEYSIDEASKEQGGVLLAVAEGQQEAALDKAVFAAEKGELQGPVRTQFGFYVFQVSKITPAKQGTLAESKQTIQQLLAAENQQKALDTFVKDFRKRWKEKTECREQYVTADCKGEPEPKPTPQEGTPVPQEQGAPPPPAEG